VLRLYASGSDNWVYLPGDKYKPDSVYSVSVQFHLVSDIQAFILEFAGYHYAKGCICLPKAPDLKISGTSVEFVGDWRTFVSPYRLEPRSAVLIQYHRFFRPPLKVMSAVDCDYGNFKVKLRYQSEDEIVERSWVFELM
jgi:hypothetical protein